MFMTIFSYYMLLFCWTSIYFLKKLQSKHVKRNATNLFILNLLLMPDDLDNAGLMPDAMALHTPN